MSEQAVNEHYLNHVVAAGDGGLASASEDIYAGNGTKLVIKGTPIDSGLRERLLAHKLRHPLERSIHVAGSDTLQDIAACAGTLLEQSALLRELAPAGGSGEAVRALGELKLTPALRCLLALQSRAAADRLRHAVSVSLIAMLLGQQVFPAEPQTHRALALAGLLHDIGELYIDPAFLARDQPLEPEQWRHIVSHPLIGSRVLADVAGAGREVADAVLLHHERLDGFGYPHGVAGSGFPLPGQIVALAEWLTGVLESGHAPMARAGMAPRLVPGEFHLALLRIVSAAARACGEAEAVEEPAGDDLAAHIARVAATLQRFQQAQPWLDGQLASAGPALREVLDASQRRFIRLQASFISTGLDTQDPRQLIAELETLGDARTRAEIAVLVREWDWRLRELKRETEVRSAGLPETSRRTVADWLVRLRGA